MACTDYKNESDSLHTIGYRNTWKYVALDKHPKFCKRSYEKIANNHVFI